MIFFYDVIAVFGTLLAAYELYTVIYARRELRRRWYFERLQVMKSKGVDKEIITKKVTELISKSPGATIYILINQFYWIFMIAALFTPMRLSSIYIAAQSIVFGHIIKSHRKVDEIDTPKMVYLNMLDHALSAVVLTIGVVQILQGR